jgi:hypothetical protein
MRVKMRVDSYNGHHVVVTFFAGEGTLANIGTLCMHTGEYQLIGCALSMGAERMHGQLVIEHEDGVFRKEAQRRALQEKEAES